MLGINAPSLHSDCDKPFMPGFKIFMPYADKEKAKAYRRLYNEKNKVFKKEYNRKYRELNREKLRDMANGWAKNNPLVVKNYILKRRYGVSVEIYNELLNKQNGCCAICGIHYTKFKRSMHIDHCHESNKIRGILCVNCNTALGHFKENIGLLQQAIKNGNMFLNSNNKKGLSKFCSDINNLQIAIIYLSANNY